MGNKIENMKFILKRWIREEGISGIVFAIVYIIFKILNSVLAIFLTSKAIFILQENKDPLKALLLIMAMIGIYVLSCTFENYCFPRFGFSIFFYRILEMPHLFLKLMKLPYEYVEGSEGKKDFEKAQEAIGSGNEVEIEGAIRSLVNFIVDGGCLAIFALLSAKLHPLIMIMLLVTGALRVIKDIKNRKWISEHQDEKSSFIYELYHLYRKCLDNKMGKDVRVYNMLRLFSI